MSPVNRRRFSVSLFTGLLLALSFLGIKGNGLFNIKPAFGYGAAFVGGGSTGFSQPFVVPSEGISIKINLAAAETSIRTVTLTLNGGTSAAFVEVSNYTDFRDSVYGAYQSSMSWTLPAGLGNKTVYAKFYSSSKQPSSLISATIKLIESTAVTPPPVDTPPEIRKYDFNPAAVKAAVGSLDLDLFAAKKLPRVTRPPCTANTLIKGTSPTLYFCGRDGKKHIFSNTGTFISWFANTRGVKKVSNPVLARIANGTEVRVRPGTKLIQVKGSSQIYVVDKGGVLRAISVTAAADLYGANWSKNVVVISAATSRAYRIGKAVAEL